MSLQRNWNTEIPHDTAQVGNEILSIDNPYRLIGEGVNDFLDLEDFACLYSEVGRGAICPIILSLITVFQFLENIPDRQAAHQAIIRIDWKYALHQPLTWLGFNFSDLSNFRCRLLEHRAERLIFEKVLEWVRSLGFLKKHGKQRSDSTHFLGNVERLSRLELVWETLRVTLRAIKINAPKWYREVIPAAFHEAYVKRQSDWRLNKAELKAAMHTAGRDGFWLLEQLHANAPPSVLELVEVATLGTVWRQQFDQDPDSQKVIVRPPGGRGKSKNCIVTPHDPDARWSEKRGKGWVGYKLHVTETAEPEATQQFITHIEAVAASTHDGEIVEAMHEQLIARNLRPTEHYVDQGYTSGANLAHSAEQGIALLGPVAGDTAGKPAGYQQSDFNWDFETQQATCPAGQVSAAWYARPQPDGFVGAEIQFKTHCIGCPVRVHCAPGKSGRTLSINPYHTLLTQRRAEQKTAAFKERMNRRSAVEGTISELTRAHGARRSRYRGLSKVRLQAFFTGAAANLKRLTRALAVREVPIASEMATC